LCTVLTIVSPRQGGVLPAANSGVNPALGMRLAPSPAAVSPAGLPDSHLKIFLDPGGKPSQPAGSVQTRSLALPATPDTRVIIEDGKTEGGGRIVRFSPPRMRYDRVTRPTGGRLRPESPRGTIAE
jgi:hypothetical protein